MSEAYHLPETDAFQVEEAKHLARRIFLRQTSHPDFREGLRMNEYFWMLCSSPLTNDEVIMGYVPKSKTLWEKNELSLIEAPAGFDFPAVTFTAHHNGLYHSAIGPVPRYLWSGNRTLYSVSNYFVLNEAGQAYREDTLQKIPAPFGYIAYTPNAMHITEPQESELGTRINLLEPSDYEMIGHYLNRIDQV
jgi:hypothetical protein